MRSPRIRDFKGIGDKIRRTWKIIPSALPSRSFSPEIVLDKVTKMNGYNITFVTTANTDEGGLCAPLRILDYLSRNAKKELIDMAKESLKAREVKTRKAC